MERHVNTNHDRKPKDTIQAGAPRLVVLGLLTLAGLALCCLMTWPFLPALTWALTLAIMAHPLHRWLAARISSPDISAFVSITLVLTLLVLPSYLVLARLGTEASQFAVTIGQESTQSELRAAMARVPGLEEAVDWAMDRIDPEEVQKLFLSRVEDVKGVLKGSLELLFQGFLMALALFYFFRDGRTLLLGVRELAPLSSGETDRLSGRVRDSIYATVYGTFVTGLLQGVTGGLLFWALGLPGPVLWGTVMFVLGILPLVGGVLVWAPVSVYLMLEGRYGAAALLMTWGVLMAGPISNFVYGSCAGNRMRLHPLPTLFSYLGGLAIFGITGMVLGPVALALTMGLLDLWHSRMVPTPRPLGQEIGIGSPAGN